METTLDTLNEQTGLLDEFFTPTEAAGLLKFKTPRPVYDARGVHKLDPPANQDIRRRDRVNAPHASLASQPRSQAAEESV